MCELKERSRLNKCNVKNLNGNEVDKIVLDTVKNLTSPDSEIYLALKKMSFEVDEIEEKQKNEIKILKQNLNNNKADIENYLEKVKYVEVEHVADLMGQVTKLKTANKEIEKQIYELNNKNQNQISDKETASLVLNMLDNYFNVFDTLDILKQRDMIRLLVNDVQTDGENLTINLLNAKGSPNNDAMFPMGDNCK